jgi:hypothetical protein
MASNTALWLRTADASCIRHIQASVDTLNKYVKNKDFHGYFFTDRTKMCFWAFQRAA